MYMNVQCMCVCTFACVCLLVCMCVVCVCVYGCGGGCYGPYPEWSTVNMFLPLVCTCHVTVLLLRSGASGWGDAK